MSGQPKMDSQRAEPEPKMGARREDLDGPFSVEPSVLSVDFLRVVCVKFRKAFNTEATENHRGPQSNRAATK
jgi:hypothetical protein